VVEKASWTIKVKKRIRAQLMGFAGANVKGSLEEMFWDVVEKVCESRFTNA